MSLLTGTTYYIGVLLRNEQVLLLTIESCILEEMGVCFCSYRDDTSSHSRVISIVTIFVSEMLSRIRQNVILSVGM